MDSAYVGLRGKWPTIMGALRWESCQKTFSVGLVWVANKAAANGETRIASRLEVVGISRMVVVLVKLTSLGWALGWKSHSVVWCWLVCPGSLSRRRGMSQFPSSSLLLSEVGTIRGDMRCKRLFGSWVEERWTHPKGPMFYMLMTY